MNTALHILGAWGVVGYAALVFFIVPSPKWSKTKAITTLLISGPLGWVIFIWLIPRYTIFKR